MQTPWGDVPVSDAHVHFFSRRFFEALAAQAGRSPQEVASATGWELPPEDPAELAQTWAAALESYGISRASLISSVPGDEASVAAAVAATLIAVLVGGLLRAARCQSLPGDAPVLHA